MNNVIMPFAPLWRVNPFAIGCKTHEFPFLHVSPDLQVCPIIFSFFSYLKETNVFPLPVLGSGQPSGLAVLYFLRGLLYLPRASESVVFSPPLMKTLLLFSIFFLAPNLRCPPCRLLLPPPPSLPVNGPILKERSFHSLVPFPFFCPAHSENSGFTPPALFNPRI